MLSGNGAHPARALALPVLSRGTASLALESLTSDRFPSPNSGFPRTLIVALTAESFHLFPVSGVAKGEERDRINKHTSQQKTKQSTDHEQ